jgi:hypothetical protein
MILNKILSKEEWRNHLLFDKDISEHLYVSNNEKIKDMLLFYKNNIIDKNNKLSYDLLKLNSINEDFIRLLKEYYSYDDKIIFQYAFSEKQLRLFINPLYHYKLEKIKKIIPVINHDDNCFFEFDINGAIPRFIFFYLYKVINNDQFKDIYLLKDDIYLFLMNELNYKIERNEFKKKFLIYLNSNNNFFNTENYIIKNIENYIKGKVNIYQGTNYWIYLLLNKLIETNNNNDIGIYFLNVDGGILYSKKNIIPVYDFLRIQNVSMS